MLSISTNFVNIFKIFSDVVMIPEPTTSTTQLYEFMLSHAKMHAMNILKMNVASEEDSVSFFTCVERYYIEHSCTCCWV